MKWNCLIVDDEPPALEVLRTYIKSIPMLQLAGECNHALSAFQLLQQQRIDLLFLDVNMPKLKGTDFIRSLEKPPKVIFTTAHAEFAVEGFDIGAVDFLLKPYSLDRFLKAVHRATATDHQTYEKIQEKADRFLYVRSDRKMIKVMIDEILYIESLKDYIKIILPSKQIITRQTISSIEEMLPEDEFIRIHRSFIISLKRIDSFDQSSVLSTKPNSPSARCLRINCCKD
jgi:DNA-binding LytR/AlgR family response regulator